MFSLLKKTDLTLDFFVDSSYSHVNEYCPVQRSSKFIPEWFKRTPKSSVETSDSIHIDPQNKIKLTARGCLGIQNILTSGVVIPWWSDLIISAAEPAYKYQFSDAQSSIEHHDNSQAPGFFEDYYILKVNSPWLLQSSRPIRYIVDPYFYSNSQSDIVVMPGIGETFGKDNVGGTNFFLAVKKTEETVTYNFKVNTPAIQIIPLTESSYKIRTKVVSGENYYRAHKITSSQISFVNPGFLKRKLSKCPFHNED